jgi:hypothetical protein
MVGIHLQGGTLPMPFPILLGLFFLHGIRAIVVSVLRLNLESPISWSIDAIGSAGFAVTAFWIAFAMKNGWSGGIPFVPSNWNQNIARAVFALGGIIATMLTVRVCRKVINCIKNKSDDGVRHT